MKAAIIQYNPVWENPEKSIEVIDKLMTNKFADADFFVFPEMTLTGFTMDSEKHAEELDGISTQYFMSLAAKIHKPVLAGIIENDNGKIYNTLVHFDKFGIITARYRKIHPFSYAKEDEYYSPGKETVVTKIDKMKVGLTICYDLRFPELYRLYGKQGVDIIINIANWPTKRIMHWKALLKARAIENQCYMIGVNRVGNDPFNEYNGCSGIIDPLGEELLMIENDEGIFVTEIDTDAPASTKQKLPFFQDIKLI